MPTIKFQKNRNPIEVPQGANLREVLVEQGIPVASSCGGVAVCSKCWVKVLEGENNLSAPNADETNLKAANNLGRLYRISCQTLVLGDVTLDTPYW